MISVVGLGDSVSIDVNDVTRIQHDGLLFIIYVLHAADRRRVALLDKLKFPVLALDGRVFMACVGVSELAGREGKDRDPDRDEHVQLVVFAELVVDRG